MASRNTAALIVKLCTGYGQLASLAVRFTRGETVV
jgi:hypothetical protein